MERPIHFGIMGKSWPSDNVPAGANVRARFRASCQIAAELRIGLRVHKTALSEAKDKLLGESSARPEVSRFIRHAARWRRFFRCCMSFGGM
jgi:hypothetical protein